jgi:hypothetical protein
VVDAFEIKASWPRRNEGEGVDATFCNLRIEVGANNVTAYRTRNHEEEDHVSMPAYYLAEWIAENWWPLLWETRKEEESTTDGAFFGRHNLMTAQQGFALPSVSLVSTGDNIDIYAAKRRIEHGDATFLKGGKSTLRRNAVEGELRKFVEATITRLKDVDDSPLQRSWTLITDTQEDTANFCQFMGALGLSPYESHPKVEEILDQASEVLTPKQLLELCQTSTLEDFATAAQLAVNVQGALRRTPEIDLSQLIGIPRPADAVAVPAYRTGYEAAKKLRSQFQIGPRDVDGARKIFEALHIDLRPRNENFEERSESAVVGATARHESSGQMILVPKISAQRRFAAARAAYFFWTDSTDEEHLITSATTRDQQASRAFAAELLIPRDYIRSEAIGGKLKMQKLADIAEREDVSRSLIKWQAENIGLAIRSS